MFEVILLPQYPFPLAAHNKLVAAEESVTSQSNSVMVDKKILT
jgi:hypothetical protein